MMFRIASVVLAVVLTGSAVLAQSLTPALKAELAPTGTLRSGINYNNPLLARRDAATGALSGIAVDLARELARRVALPVELVPYDAAGRMGDAAKTAAWDIAFLGIDPGRASYIDFTAPYIELEGTYLVPAGSPLRRVEDVDREGVRIVVTAGSAYDLFLTRELKRAQLVRTETTPESFDLMRTQKLDAVAAVRTALVAVAPGMPGSQVLSGRFMTIPQAAGIPRGRPAAARFVRQFIEEMKASGFVAAALRRHGLQPHDAIVAPPAVAPPAPAR
jgi:polar amino acid transport system substrate-binding protein